MDKDNLKRGCWMNEVFKSSMCRSVLEGTGKCHFIFPDKDKCEFAHSKEEMEMWANWRKKRWGKRTMCKNLATCKYDATCRFSHTEEECKWWNQTGPMKDSKLKWSLSHPLRPPSPPPHLLPPPRPASPPTTTMISPPVVAAMNHHHFPSLGDNTAPPATPIVPSKLVPAGAPSPLFTPTSTAAATNGTSCAPSPLLTPLTPLAVLPSAFQQDFSMFHGDSATWHLPQVFTATCSINSSIGSKSEEGYNVMDQLASTKDDFPCDWLKVIEDDGIINSPIISHPNNATMGLFECTKFA
ncbi:hypothetical protein BASA81_001968 [Batrachochytrium salamandrivorans]|nr:hypothetical protein BASA81_001968 [Batrachochytrium salamandrivorans]